MDDFLFRGSLQDLDPNLYKLTQIEAERQVKKLILIPSESQAPLAVREALSSAFQNIYAEGYPDESSRLLSEDQLFDYCARLTEYRRYSDSRYYKGVEYADIAEAIARRRCAELFSTNGITADEIFVNVQALSGAPANNAVYHAILQPGDTIMGMDLLHGGHLSHGATVNRSGKLYKSIQYSIDPENGRINYEHLEEFAQENKPKIIIAGYSSYPWKIDWSRFRKIADSVGAYLFADIAHVAGLVAGGVYPSPVGYADVITFTTHKSLCGPRGACILTTDNSLSRKIDRAVFPGEQGGPHVNVFLAMALTFKLARSEQFRELQKQVVINCATLSDKLKENGLRIAFGGTDTHLLNVDCSSIVGLDGTKLSGDQAVRILDIAGIVMNRNTIPGDLSALDPSGIRMGTHWVTQRGFKEQEIIELANIISNLINAMTPYSLEGRNKRSRRAKIDFTALEVSKLHVHDLAEQAGLDFQPTSHDYPHFYYLDDMPASKWGSYEISGENARQFLNFSLASDIELLLPQQAQLTRIFTPAGEVDGRVTFIDETTYRLDIPAARSGLAVAWLRDLSDGYVKFDDDITRKLPGPVCIKEIPSFVSDMVPGELNNGSKPYYIGMKNQDGNAFPEFRWESQDLDLRKTPLYETHQELGAKIIPFAGWELPVWYSSVLEEHQAVRNAAGLFDVTHMGVYQAEGKGAVVFLDCVMGNHIGGLKPGDSCYTHMLDPDSNVIDDLFIYRRSEGKFLLVVNAANDVKNWAWLNAIKNGEVQVSRSRPYATVYGKDVILRNLRDLNEADDMLVDIALQGPRAMDVLLKLEASDETKKRIKDLNRSQLCELSLADFNLIIARTGYTGEKIGFEIFIHPQNAVPFFRMILDVGKELGVKPIGLGARDSLRTEAGLPLYGHEMGAGSGKLGEPDLGVAEAGFGSYVKIFKPWFIGRSAYFEREKSRSSVVVRFRFNDKGIRMAHNGDPVMDKRGRVIGWVTSCAVDREGMLTGLAYIENRNAYEGNEIFIFQGAPDDVGKTPINLVRGDKALLASQASIISRFIR